jgi:hypothetical protein
VLFDIVNLVIALGALVLALFTAYWQHRKVDGLKIVFLSQGARAGKGEGTTALCVTFSVANTGTLPAIVSAAHYVLLHPDEPARQTIILGRDDAGAGSVHI